jgi:long-chain fatty acid transport protein
LFGVVHFCVFNENYRLFAVSVRIGSMRIPLKAVLLIYSLFNSDFLFAGGFQVNLQGQKQTGMGHIGTGVLSDASCVFFNPGGMTFLDSSTSIVGGCSFIIPRTQYLEAYPGTYTENMEHNMGTPFALYFSHRFKKLPKLAAGLAVYTPFGSRAQWPDDWKGQFIIREINLKTIFIQPTISYKVTDKVGIGLGFIYSTGEFSLRKGVPIQDLAGSYGEGTLEGKANGTGFNAGIYFEPIDALSIGFSYRSKVVVKVDEGASDFKVPGYLESYFPSTNFSAELNLPQVVTAGVAYKISSKVRLAFELNYIGWSVYDSLRIDFKENTEKLDDISSARNYENVFIYRLGAEYKLNNTFTFRGGIYLDKSPVPDGYITPETPDADRIGLTTGFSYKPTARFSIDASLLYNETKERTSHNLETNFEGTFKTKTMVPGLGFEYIF